jgi:hypothetical protein
VSDDWQEALAAAFEHGRQQGRYESDLDHGDYDTDDREPEARFPDGWTRIGATDDAAQTFIAPLSLPPTRFASGGIVPGASRDNDMITAGTPGRTCCRSASGAAHLVSCENPDWGAGGGGSGPSWPSCQGTAGRLAPAGES